MKKVPTASGDCVTRVVIKMEDIKFRPRIQIEQHPRYRAFRHFIGMRDFAAYREVFERGWAETSIMCSDLVRLDDLPITHELPPSTLLVNLMGVNEHSPRRVGLVEEFIGEYERIGRSRFLKGGAFKTDYVRDLVATTGSRIDHLRGPRGMFARWRQGRRVRQRVTTFMNIYENMKRFRTLVARSHVLQEIQPPLGARDLPWAIDYCGYIKLREGAHRRAAAHYLGWDTIPTLVFEFDRVTSLTLKDAHPYLRDNFDWFATTVREVASLGLVREIAENSRKNRELNEILLEKLG